jgi:hypothetical protein
MAYAPAQPPADPALVRLREVAERIRQRVAAGRKPAPAAPARLPRQPAPTAPAPPPHWSDGKDGGPDEPAQH